MTNCSDDDNWDDDFATAISPSALQLPHLKPQDNFGGLLSNDKLKAFASINDERGDSNHYDEDFEGELLTIRGLSHYQEIDPQEQTIRPFTRKPEKVVEPPKSHHRAKSSSSKAMPSRPKSPQKTHVNKFELPPRPDLAYREQSVDDYSDLFVDDNVFDSHVNQAVKKVRTRLLNVSE